MGVTTSLLLEHRGGLLERFGDEGRAFVYGLEVFHGFDKDRFAEFDALFETILDDTPKPLEGSGDRI